MSNEQEKKQTQEEEKDSVEFIFEGVFKAEENKQLYKKYKSFTKKLINIKNENNQIKLNHEEIKSIFKNLDNVLVNYCEIYEELEFYEIILNYDFKEINYDKIYSLKKTEYCFTFKQTKYYCFLITSMNIYLENLLKETDFFFEISYESSRKKQIKDIKQFMMSNSTDFKIMISYQFKDIDYKDINYDLMFKKSNTISGEELNLKLGHYVSLTEEQYKKFKYFHTEQREIFFSKIISVLEIRNMIGICGPYGTGKTITLLRMIIKDPRHKCFYVNLATVNKLPLGELKKTLKYEIIKLYSKRLIFPDENPLDKANKLACDKSLNLIDKFEGKNIFKLLKDMIMCIKDTNYQKIYFIIDQYSSKFDIDKNWIKNLLKFSEDFDAKQKQKIKLVICSSMNNSSVKSDLCECLSEEMIFPKFTVDNSFIFYLYVGSLVRLNELENYNMIIQNESEEFITYLNYFGNLPFYYYYLKNEEQRKTNFYSSIIDEEDKIIEEIKNFYQNNNQTISKSMINDIMNIILYINKKEIFFWQELSRTISILPLKFLEIKKETILVNDLKLYGLIAGDKKVLQFIENLEKSNAQDLQNNEYILGNYTKFMKEEKFCNNFISKVTENDKIKLNYTRTNFDKKVTIFYLDYLFPLMEEIFSKLNYQIYSKASQILYYELPGQTQGRLLELIIWEHIKNKKKLFDLDINDFAIVENFVPNEFYIQNYISRKKDTIRTYIENKNFKGFKKKKLPKKIVFVKQLQFTGKYYDCALLIPLKTSSEYILVLFQISKKKIKSQRFYKEEHMIIINRVKSKLESEFDIEIKEAHFSYILNSDEEDKETIEFCQNNNLNYYLFSVNHLSFGTPTKRSFLNDKTLVTKNFPFHSSFSILSKEIFEENKGKLIKYEYINKIQKTLIFEDIEGDLKKLLNKNYNLIYDLPKNDKNTYKIFGHFDEVFEVNNDFCIWFNNDELFFYIYKKNKGYLPSKIKYSKKLSDKNYSLICSKYKINTSI